MEPTAVTPSPPDRLYLPHPSLAGATVLWPRVSHMQVGNSEWGDQAGALEAEPPSSVCLWEREGGTPEEPTSPLCVSLFSSEKLR